ncbi:uncharacterized protein ATNIH1004_002414 [Aspergillus tanneri]|uniref:Uncharacterized protein n=1 Tax=Aspergillus tanneri TaxID=1220188 RepID=A0A5M9MWM7_9EURO|nr:uncharacterized protein ATNIH1004_002414 [Aspergillus tanneri]KAA8649740.1 hypothetical protein ATNIH1004_002414 [Aspergillus tanneri]
MPQQPLNIPLRTSSANAVQGGLLSGENSREEVRLESTSKAQKILGTRGIPFHQDNQKREDKKRGHRPSFMKTSETKSKKVGNFVPFPASIAENSLSPQHLRVRASSPLLGQEYRTQDQSPPPVPRIPKIHHSGSASTLYSYFTSRDSSADTNKATGNATKDLDPSTDGSNESQQNAGGSSGLKQPAGFMKESKRKMRPPRIDLSLLFPKPRESAAPLLSPQRMVKSPSAISLASEYSAPPSKKTDSHATGKRLTKLPPSSRRSARRPSGLQSISDAGESLTPYDAHNTNWTDPTLERAVPTSEMDLALERYSDVQQASPSAARSLPNRLHLRTRNREELPGRNDSQPPNSSLQKAPSISSSGAWSKETYLSPKNCSRPRDNRVSNSPDARRIQFQGKPPTPEDYSMSRKSSKSTLTNSDLNNLSVLCLSSSEDENEEDEEREPTKGKPELDKGVRDSIATYDDFEPEICTASAAQATRGSVRQVDRSISTSSRGSRPVQRQQSLLRNPSMSSAGRSSVETRKSQSRRSGGIPTISEPEFIHGDPIFSQLGNSALYQNRNSGLSQKEMNRRSRVIAVTRQEESFLEAMREREGKITPSLFQESRYNAQEPDRNSMLSVAPSRDSFYGSGMSFLRLSPGFPPNRARIDQGAVSDTEQKTINSSASPRASLVYSESLSSPATSAASPMTPTLPIHRFSPLPSQKPTPRRPPPTIPDAQKRHSRRRTDSSEAIVLDDTEELKEKNEFPLWAVGWNSEGASLTAVH